MDVENQVVICIIVISINVIRGIDTSSVFCGIVFIYDGRCNVLEAKNFANLVVLKLVSGHFNLFSALILSQTFLREKNSIDPESDLNQLIPTVSKNIIVLFILLSEHMRLLSELQKISNPNHLFIITIDI